MFFDVFIDGLPNSMLKLESTPPEVFWLKNFCFLIVVMEI